MLDAIQDQMGIENDTDTELLDLEKDAHPDGAERNGSHSKKGESVEEVTKTAPRNFAGLFSCIPVYLSTFLTYVPSSHEFK